MSIDQTTKHRALIETAFVQFRSSKTPSDDCGRSPEQVARMAFFAGAIFVLASVFQDETSDDDMIALLQDFANETSAFMIANPT